MSSSQSWIDRMLINFRTSSTRGSIEVIIFAMNLAELEYYAQDK